MEILSLMPKEAALKQKQAKDCRTKTDKRKSKQGKGDRWKNTAEV